MCRPADRQTDTLTDGKQTGGRSPPALQGRLSVRVTVPVPPAARYFRSFSPGPIVIFLESGYLPGQVPTATARRPMPRWSRCPHVPTARGITALFHKSGHPSRVEAPEGVSAFFHCSELVCQAVLPDRPFSTVAGSRAGLAPVGHDLFPLERARGPGHPLCRGEPVGHFT